MTVVNTSTGEVIDFDKAAAERRAERITLRLESIANNYNAVLPMIREAIAKRDDLALGYRSPGEYVSDRFGQSLAGLGIEVRRQVVRELTEAGMSTRAIAPVVGVSNYTVQKDREAGVSDLTPATGTNAEAWADPNWSEDEDLQTPSARPVASPSDVAEVEGPGEEVEPTPPTPAPSRPVTTGIDGKNYPKPEPRTPRRKALTDSFFTAAYDMGKAIEKVARLTEDDRFPQNADQVAAKHRNDLIRSRDLLEQVIESLPKEQHTND